MRTDLIDTVTSSLSPEQIDNAASTVNLPEPQTRGLMPGVVAAVLAVLLQRSSTSLGRAEIVTAVSAYGNPTTNRTGMLDRVLGGDRVGPVTDVVAKHAGVSRVGARSLLAIAVTAVMGLLGRTVATRQMNAAGLAGHLGSQRSSIIAYAPLGLAAALGLRSLAELGEVRRPPVQEKRKLGILAALVALAGILLLFGAFSITRRVHPYQPPTITGVNIVAPKVPTSPLDEAFTSTSTLPATLPVGTIEFPFASATPSDESVASIDTLATALKKYPSARVRIDGHTDAIGQDDFNQTLSTQRAAAVKSLLQERGVDVDHVTIAGHSERHFVADNTLEPGRAQNRRVEATLLSR